MSYPHPGTVQCPYCDVPIECDMVDVGIGFVQCGPYHCDLCQASEIGPEGLSEDLDEDERRTGFYKSRISPHANIVQGTLVSHQVAKAAYRKGLLDKKP